MRFGPWILQMSADPNLDCELIHKTLDQIALADALGLDCAWLAEHHFSGDTAYADPVVFAAAAAMRTQRITLGFAVVQMALHHPVRLAVQTALLDNLSRGRLIVGTGRGSIANRWEYEGFGTTLEEGAERLAEAEDLLIQAWTQERVDFQGKFWRGKFARIRPRPYQRPHPPIVRACVSAESTEAMGRLGRPIMLTYGTASTIADRLTRYREAMLSAGFPEAAVENALDDCWVTKSLYVAEEPGQAREEANEGFAADTAHLERAWNEMDGRPKSFGLSLEEHNLLVGTPRQVAERVAELRDTGVRNLMFSMTPSGLPPDKVARSFRLFAEEVAPRFRVTG